MPSMKKPITDNNGREYYVSDPEDRKRLIEILDNPMESPQDLFDYYDLSEGLSMALKHI